MSVKIRRSINHLHSKMNWLEFWEPTWEILMPNTKPFQTRSMHKWTTQSIVFYQSIQKNSSRLTNSNWPTSKLGMKLLIAPLRWEHYRHLSCRCKRYPAICKGVYLLLCLPKPLNSWKKCLIKKQVDATSSQRY